MRRVGVGFRTLLVVCLLAGVPAVVASPRAYAADHAGVIVFTTPVYVGNVTPYQLPGDVGEGLCQPGFRAQDRSCLNWDLGLRTDPNTWMLEVPDRFANLEPPTTCVATGVFDDWVVPAETGCSLHLNGLFTANELGVGPSCSTLATSTESWEPAGFPDQLTINGVRSELELAWSSGPTDVSALQGALTYPNGHEYPLIGYAWVRPWYNASCLSTPTTRLIVSAVLVTTGATGEPDPLPAWITDLVNEIGDDASPAAPELVAPTNAASFPFGQPEEFVVKATDPDGEPYTATVTVEDAVTGAQRTFASLPTPSGSAATAPIMDGPLAVGPYRWWATATDLTGHTGPPSATRTFSVGAA